MRRKFYGWLCYAIAHGDEDNYTIDKIYRHIDDNGNDMDELHFTNFASVWTDGEFLYEKCFVLRFEKIGLLDDYILVK